MSEPTESDCACADRVLWAADANGLNKTGYVVAAYRVECAKAERERVLAIVRRMLDGARGFEVEASNFAMGQRDGAESALLAVIAALTAEVP